MKSEAAPPAEPVSRGSEHPFVRHPHRTLLVLSFPVLLSLVAEPLTGLVDTAFVASLGVAPLAALGVGTMALSSFYWIFNFLGIGTQTEVARNDGKGDRGGVAESATIAVVLGLILGSVVWGAGWYLSNTVAALLGAVGDVATLSVEYMRIRWIGGPAVLLMVAGFGILRGLQDMRTPLVVAVGVNVLNVGLDYLLVFGWGTIPAMGIAGAAAASTISQWLGAAWVLRVLWRRLGRPGRIRWREAGRLLRVGGDLLIRTGALSLFLLLATRAATRAGADAGAVHQVIRQVWFFTALFLDSFAVTGQSLVAFFLGAGWIEQARRVAAYVCAWSLATGLGLAMGMLALSATVAAWLVPAGAVRLFSAPWWVAAGFQPLNALSFATDGIHWGTGDFRYLRNAVLLATATGTVALAGLAEQGPEALVGIWWVTGLWICVRALFGIVRIWPGLGNAPLTPVARAADSRSPAGRERL